MRISKSLIIGALTFLSSNLSWADKIIDCDIHWNTQDSDVTIRVTRKFIPHPNSPKDLYAELFRADGYVGTVEDFSSNSYRVIVAKINQGPNEHYPLYAIINGPDFKLSVRLRNSSTIQALEMTCNIDGRRRTL